MYISLTVTFLLLLGIVIISLQNSIPVVLTFITWDLHMPLTALVLYSSLIGAAIVAVLALPKLMRKSLDVRSLHKEIRRLKKNIEELGKEHINQSQVE